MSFRKVVSGLLSVALLALMVGVVFFRQEAYDWWRLRDYKPSQGVAALAQATTMTDEGRQLFYVTHPAVVEAETFNQQCHIEEFSIILGCYVQHGLAANIYIYDVTDKRLSGIKEVTAAHEMLHGVYERLPDDERARLDEQLIDAYKQLNNQRIKDTIAQYEANDPSAVANELHSILGTEVRDLPNELEAHYQQYFTDRKTVVGFSEKYEAVFHSRQARVKQLDRQLEGLRTEIENNQNRLAELNAQLGSERQALDQLQASNQTAEYNARVDDYNALVNEYNALVETTRQQITMYNAIVKERNSLVIEVRDLMEAIDSTPEKLR